LELLPLVVCVPLLLPVPALGLGADHPKGPISADNASWPQGLLDLANRPDRVHGFWVNDVDVFFYAGDSKALHDFLAAYAKLKDTQLRVVLHPGRGEARSPWDRTARGPADWRLYVEAGNPDPMGPRTLSRVDVWLGGGVRLADLRVPPNVAVASGGEIEAFIQAHRKKSRP
jgi:hypothetical protein